MTLIYVLSAMTTKKTGTVDTASSLVEPHGPPTAYFPFWCVGAGKKTCNSSSSEHDAAKPRSDLEQHLAGLLSEEEYFHRVNGRFGRPMPTAPYCDQRKYTKFDPDPTWQHGVELVGRTTLTPTRKKPRHRVLAPALCPKTRVLHGTEDDFCELCVAFADLRVPWTELKQGAQRRTGTLVARPASSTVRYRGGSSVRASAPALTQACSSMFKPMRSQKSRTHEPLVAACRTLWTEEDLLWHASHAQQLQELRADVCLFTATLPVLSNTVPQDCRRSPALPRGLDFVDEVTPWNFHADRAFARRHTMQGRSTKRKNNVSRSSAFDKLEAENFGRVDDLTDADRHTFRTYTDTGVLALGLYNASPRGRVS